MTSGPIVALELVAEDAVAKWRACIGVSRVFEARLDTTDAQCKEALRRCVWSWYPKELTRETETFLLSVGPARANNQKWESLGVHGLAGRQSVLGAGWWRAGGWLEGVGHTTIPYMIGLLETIPQSAAISCSWVKAPRRAVH